MCYGVPDIRQEVAQRVDYFIVDRINDLPAGTPLNQDPALDHLLKVKRQ
jgi:hypothetical protein